MAPDLDRRTYDILRLVDRHSPIGSIHLVELMQLHGYDIKDRTIRLSLSELDELGLTEKVPGRGRRLTEKGRRELGHGDVSGRLEQIRARIATLTSEVTYDPTEDVGVLVASAAFLEEDDVADALSLVARLESLPLGPLPVSLEESAPDEPGTYRLICPSSITLDGVLLAHGINANLTTAGVLEYEPSPSVAADETESTLGGRINRYVDVINGEGSSVDVITLLIESGRSDVSSILEDGEIGLLVGDDRDFPINRFEEARDLSTATRGALGGVIAFRKPREQEQFPGGDSAWAFGSITSVGGGELLLAALNEYGLSDSWKTLYGTVPRRDLQSVHTVAELPRADD